MLKIGIEKTPTGPKMNKDVTSENVFFSNRKPQKPEKCVKNFYPIIFNRNVNDRSHSGA